MVEPDEIDAGIAGLNISGVPVNLIQKGYVQKVIHMWRLVAGTETTGDVQKNREEKMSSDGRDEGLRGLTMRGCAAFGSHRAAGTPEGRSGSEESVPKISNEEMTRHWGPLQKGVRAGPQT